MKKRIKMKELPVKERINCFDEVALGYSFEEAMQEAMRCIQCTHAPCISGCPVEINIPAFIKEIINNDIKKAYEIITNDNLLPGICGRVCPQEVQCEIKCVRGIKGESVAIGRLERFVSDNYKETPIKINATKESVAIIGSGPAGLACSGVLAQKGYQVHVYEALHELGGVLIYGIPEFRLPKKIVKEEIQKLKDLGVVFHINTVIGRTISLNELLEDHKAVFVGTGAGLPKFMNIPGENLNGVFSANEFLTRVNLMKAYKEEYDTPLKEMKKVIVIGGGNVAMDAARSAKRLGASVIVLYRRSWEEMPARKEEVDHAFEEGVEFKFLVNPIEIKGKDYFVNEISCIKMELTEPDSSGRRRPEPIPNSEFTIEADTVIMSLGNSPNPLLCSATSELVTNKYGCLVVDGKQMTSKEGVFAGGDAVTGAATVILAMEAGKKAAVEIDKYLNKKHRHL